MVDSLSKKNPFKKRLAQLMRLLQADSISALVLSSAPTQPRSRDTEYPYRQSSDFFYLTGIVEAGYTLVLHGSKGGFLISEPVDPMHIVWNGAPASAKKLAAELGLEPIISANVRGEITKLLRGTHRLFFQNTKRTVAWDVASELFGAGSHQRADFPVHFEHTDILLAPLRLIKDAAEVEAIRAAARITNAALYGAIGIIRPGTTEREIAAAIEFYFKSQGAYPGFNSIVATGAAAATLHYEKTSGILKSGELLLLDIGAELNLYSADVTRVIPVNGTFTELQRDLYTIVLESQRVAIKKMRPGVTLLSVYEAAAKVLNQGLHDVGVLRGKASKTYKEGSFKKYFPHNIGHSLGLDVHDIQGIAPRAPLELKKGMVITIEPGLYFRKRVGKIPAMGIRIEDDVLVTATGSEIISDGFPKKIDDLEKLF